MNWNESFFINLFHFTFNIKKLIHSWFTTFTVTLIKITTMLKSQINNEINFIESETGSDRI